MPKFLREDECNLCGERAKLYSFSRNEAPRLHEEDEGVACWSCGQGYMEVDDYEVDTRSDWDHDGWEDW